MDCGIADVDRLACGRSFVNKQGQGGAPNDKSPVSLGILECRILHGVNKDETDERGNVYILGRWRGDDDAWDTFCWGLA